MFDIEDIEKFVEAVKKENKKREEWASKHKDMVPMLMEADIPTFIQWYRRQAPFNY